MYKSNLILKSLIYKRNYHFHISSVSSIIMDVRFLLFIFGALTLSKLANHCYYNLYDDDTFDRSKFPDHFVFGTASSAYQYEGAYKEDGKGPSIWDTFTHQHPEKIAGGANGDVADDQYHRYKEDVSLMKDLGFDAYRFSISWSRVLPNGKLSGGVNRLGIQYYNNLIDELLSKGLKPFVTLFHWDVPQHLDSEYGGFLSPRIVEDFHDYAELCFKEFGDRVKHWITVNEPRTFCNDAYNLGRYAPGRCSPSVGNCSAGNSSTEPYLVGHNLLLAHAAAVKLYRGKYQADQKGKIGITIVFRWILPMSEAKIDITAAERGRDFFFGWFMDPLTKGYYPAIMKAIVGNRLPEFSKEESDMVKGSFDFLGLNYYTSCYAENVPISDQVPASYLTDSHVNLISQRNGIPLGPTAASSWLVVYPEGFRNILVHVKNMYGDPTIYVTENGYDDFSNVTLSESLADMPRIDYYSAHLKFLLEAIKEGVDVRGYFAWSLLDNIEWADGYTVRFGINYVNYKTLQRYPKASAIWFKKFLLQS